MIFGFNIFIQRRVPTQGSNDSSIPTSNVDLVSVVEAKEQEQKEERDSIGIWKQGDLDVCNVSQADPVIFWSCENRPLLRFLRKRQIHREAGFSRASL